MRTLCLAILTVAMLAPAGHSDELFDKLTADVSKGKAIKNGMKALEIFFRYDSEMRGGGRKATAAIGKRAKALTVLLEWLDETETTLGTDLRKQHKTVLEFAERARAKLLNTKYSKNKIQYVRVDAKGYERFEYAAWMPRAYTHQIKKGKPWPAIISMHGRVIDPGHPSFRAGAATERGRKAIWNNWLKSPTADQAIIIAPTGDPKGFLLRDKVYEDFGQLYSSMREVLSRYRVDWNRIFVEMEGSALRLACYQPFMFAGVIVRDYIEDRRGTAIPPEEMFILDNLNGLPLCYIADEKHWDTVGKPMSEALTAAYAKAGAPQNLIILKAKRNANEALRNPKDDAKIAAFIAKHRRIEKRETFSWRFFNPFMRSPLPVDLTGANYSYDEGVPLAKTAGAFTFKYKLETVDNKPVNVFDFTVTEVESLRIDLHDGIADLNYPITIKVNGKVVKENATVKRDWEFFFDKIAPGFLWMVPFVGSITADCDPKPQYTPPGETKPANGEKTDTPKKDGAATGAAGDGAKGK